MKVLLGGVPFGCDNVGDEAIIACVVRLFRERLPEAELTVATNDPRTAEFPRFAASRRTVRHFAPNGMTPG